MSICWAHIHIHIHIHTPDLNETVIAPAALCRGRPLHFPGQCGELLVPSCYFWLLFCLQDSLTFNKENQAAEATCFGFWLAAINQGEQSWP